MAKSYAEDMADEMGHDGEEHDGEDGDELDGDDYGGSLEKAMEDLGRHLKEGDWSAAARCFRDATVLAEKHEDEQDGGADDSGEFPMPGDHALLMIPHGGK